MYQYAAILTRWVDADTFKAKVDLGFKVTVDETFRVSRINAPELNTVEGQQALAYARSLVIEGSKILLVTSKPDKYGRWLADIQFFDGTTYTERAVADGHATWA